MAKKSSADKVVTVIGFPTQEAREEQDYTLVRTSIVSSLQDFEDAVKKFDEADLWIACKLGKEQKLVTYFRARKYLAS